jgi:pimeloyl-ACP methyl ester carboxylesterase
MWGSGEYIMRYMMPTQASDENLRRAQARRERQSASPAAAIACIQMSGEVDARDILPTIQVPTLVLHRTGDARITIDAGRYIADHIPGAKFVELPGVDHIPYYEPDIGRPHRG